MNILYIASGIPIPGTLGGSTHTLEVARGLAARGHTVHVVAVSKEQQFALSSLMRPISTFYDMFHLHYLDVPKAASLSVTPIVKRLARATQPDVVMERYYNFAGCGVFVAQDLGIPLLLEVNALIIDPPAVFKRRLDDWLGRPMRRWAVQQCRVAQRMVTPLHTTVPEEIARDKIIELPWGANVERFELLDTVIPEPLQLERRFALHTHSTPVVVFLGSFRAWHGTLELIRAAVHLLEQGARIRFLLIGDGPDRAMAEQMVSEWTDYFLFTGAITYEQVPYLLSQATIGIAPFNTQHHPALCAAGFFWSPLKVYEYMAAVLPTVTTDIHPLNQVIRDGQEGLLFHEGDVLSLSKKIEQLINQPEHIRIMGEKARKRVADYYSWHQHCAELERILTEMVIQNSST
ncbi:MAG: glycosyltransferase family 4 protein [Chloroflexota bacterium]